MASSSLEPIDLGQAIRLFRYMMMLLTAYWAAIAEGKLSRFIAPPEELESSIRELTNDVWRGIGDAIRAGDSHVEIRSSSDWSVLPDRGETISKMLAFVPVARESGVDVPHDPECEHLLHCIVVSLSTAGEAAAETTVTDLAPRGPLGR